MNRYPLDPILLWSALLICVLGLLMVTSASMPMAADAGDPWFFSIRQTAFFVIGLVAAALTFCIPMRFWERQRGFLLLMAAFMLLLVLVIGREVNGATRWIAIGPINLQVSEVARLLVVLYLASYLKRHQSAIARKPLAVLKPLMVLSALSVLLLLQPDFGATAVMFATALGMMFLAGANLLMFIVLIVGVLIAAGLLILIEPYRMARLVGFLDPWADPLASGFQLTQSLIAIGRGELFGVGLGGSVQKLFYLPEAHTDFIFAVTAEELGLLGIVLTVSLYSLMVMRMLTISARAEAQKASFGSLVASGIALWFGMQTLVNLGVNMGVLPTKGLTLPLMSYGGSSLVVMMMAIALVLRVAAENYAHTVETHEGSVSQLQEQPA